MTRALYEIRNAKTNWKLLANATARQVERFFKKENVEAVRHQAEGGVIVIYVADKVTA